MKNISSSILKKNLIAIVEINSIYKINKNFMEKKYLVKNLVASLLYQSTQSFKISIDFKFYDIEDVKFI